ncbi:MAG: alkaline phosphatase family protein [Brevundimonas sp.]|uniref:alkaline phosphatase family protein n=1 Tax=Brevundimonas sp. TaxID=1871086 RepID=UPI00391C3B88
MFSRLAVLALLAALPSTVQAAERPPLIVAVSIDQLSSNLFNQYRSQVSGGFKTLIDQGRLYANGYQTHGVTVTCAGHATLLTGRHPATNGIPANDWIDTTTGETTYCLAAPDNHLAHGDDTSDNGPVGPQRMTATTLGDWIKAGDPAARVFAVSGKDRGAIAMAGQRPDGAFWFTGAFGLTTYVEPGQTAEARLAPVAEFNQAFQAAAAQIEQGGAEQGEGDATSDDIPPFWSGAYPQCQALARGWTVGDFTFASQVPPASQQFDTSPLLDEATLDAGRYLIESQQLGARGHTDVLSVSLSGTDRIGHSYGTQGPEMCEQMHRLDAALGRFMQALPAGTVLVLTSDHGGSDFPERMAEQGSVDSRRLDPAMTRRINDTLRQRFGLDANPLVSGGGGFVIVDGERRALAEPMRSQVLAAAVELLNAESDVELAVARDELLAEPLPTEVNPENLTVRERLRLSAVAERSPDILRAWKWGVNSAVRQGGAVASHGSPWDYDRRVPIVFWKAGEPLPAQERFWPIRTVDIAPTLAAIVGVTPAETIDGRCVELSFGDAPVCPAP